MTSLGLFYLVSLIAVTVIAAVLFKRAGYLGVAAKGAFGSFGVLLVACFVYGLFNRFSFWHGAGPPGIGSGVGYAIIFGISVGPIVFVVGGLASAAICHFYRLKKRKAAE